MSTYTRPKYNNKSQMIPWIYDGEMDVWCVFEG